MNTMHAEMLVGLSRLRECRPCTHCAAGRMPAISRVVVRGELAIVDIELRSHLSVYDTGMPMKMIVLVLISTASLCLLKSNVPM